MRATHLLLALSVGAVTLGQAWAASPSDVEAAKKSAAQIAAAANRNSGVTLGPDGKAHSGPNTGSLDGASKVLNQITGFQGLTDLRNPIHGGVGGASAQVGGSIDLSCKIHKGQQRIVAGGVTVRLTGCIGARSIDLEVCTALLQGRSCRPADFRQVRVPAGSWVGLDNLQIGAGCNDAQVCRVSVVNRGYSIEANGQGLKEAAAAQSVLQRTEEGKASFAGAIASTATSAEFQKAYNDSKQFMTDCIDGMQRDLKTGKMVACNGSAVSQNVADKLMGNKGPSCTTIKECLKPGTRTLEFNRTCTRTFPTTNYSCEYKIPTLTCHITPASSAGGAPSVSCPGADELRAKPDFKHSSATAPGAGVTPGMPPTTPHVTSKIKGEAAASAQYADLLAGALLVRKDEATEVYVVPTKAEQVGDCTAGPNPLAGPAGPGICATPLVDQVMECKEWVGRTQPEALCNEGTAGTLGYEGCGYCTNPVYSQLCQGAPTSESMDSCSGAGVEGCELIAERAESVEGGIVTSATQTYRCTKTEQTCLEWKREEACEADLALGMDKITYKDNGANQEAFNKAMIATAVMQAYEEAMADGSAVRVFGGEDRRCTRPRGIMSMLSNDCCSINLERVGGKKWLNKCSQDDVKLAAARRAQYTYFVGEYCSKRRFGSCLARTQTYCAYPGLLPRIINEQGRVQLAEAVASAVGAAVQTQQLTYSYYHPAGGGWTPVTEVNGVRLAAWQQPAHCRSLDNGGQALNGDPLECPGRLTTILAACERGGACSTLPAHPDFGSDSWTFTYVDPLSGNAQAVSRVAVAKGGCDPKTGSCTYEVRAWPAATGGRAVASNDLYLPLFGNPADDYSLANLGDVFFRRKPQPAQSGLPATVVIEYSRDAGKTWSSVAVRTAPGSTTTVPGTDVELTGQCSESSNSCLFRAVGTVEASAKPWGPPQAPDCTGFTPGQMASIDFAKMDLSEWIASVLAKVGAADTRGLSEVAKEQAKQYYEAFTGGVEIRQQATPPTADNFATIYPREQMGPFNVTLRVGGNFPRTYEDPALNTNPVLRVEVDWDDGTEPEQLQPVSPERGFGFEANHHYRAPNELPNGRAVERTVEHKVKVTVVTKQGTHVMHVMVRNLWSNYTGDRDLGRLKDIRPNR